jgi:hypothetical protein
MGNNPSEPLPPWPTSQVSSINPTGGYQGDTITITGTNLEQVNSIRLWNNYS